MDKLDSMGATNKVIVVKVNFDEADVLFRGQISNLESRCFQFCKSVSLFKNLKRFCIL